jgi:beta-aspartyl-peptidase (threonine type)
MIRSFAIAMATSAAVNAVLFAAEPPVADVVLAIHGGTGTARRNLAADTARAMRADLDAALVAGYERLSRPGGSSMDAVEAAIRVLEDSPHFNAGKGAVFNHDGRIELDAAVMAGAALEAGAVAAVTTIRNPVSAARAVMEKSKHVLLVAQGAEKFAAAAGLEIVDPSYFRTERRWQELQRALQPDKQSGTSNVARPGEHAWGTVGAVALDGKGNLAAGTSTGGRTNKLSGRVGDSPLIGAGTYADNRTCAVSGTGHGEFFIRFLAAYDIAAQMKYRGLTVDEAAADVVMRKLKQAGGEGGMIALDANGHLAMPFNTDTMYRGYVTRDAKRTVLLFED